MDEHHHLHHLLLPSATATAVTTGGTTSNGDAGATSSNFGIAFRILLVLLIGLVSTWANQEASKGFMITVTNDMENTSLGKKFSLFYVSNDEVTRLVQYASDFATGILYPNPNGMPEKFIERVDIRLANWNMTCDHVLAAEGVGEKSKYVIFISPQVMEFSDFRRRIKREIQRGMAEILLSGIQNGAPKTMLDGMVEYVSNLAGVGPERRVFKLGDVRGKCWEDEDPEIVAEFLGYCEEKSKGFIRRLNQAVREGSWDEETLDRALGMPAKHFCESFHSSMVMKIQDLNSSNSVSGYRKITRCDEKNTRSTESLSAQSTAAGNKLHIAFRASLLVARTPPAANFSAARLLYNLQTRQFCENRQWLSLSNVTSDTEDAGCFIRQAW